MVFFHPGQPVIPFLAFLELRICRILDVIGSVDADGVFHPGRHQYRSHRSGHAVQVVGGLPANLGCFFDGLGGKLGRCDVEESVGTAGLQADDLAVHRGVGHLVGDLGHNHGPGLVAQSVFKAFQIIFAIVIVLVQHGNLGTWLGFQNVGREIFRL